MDADMPRGQDVHKRGAFAYGKNTTKNYHSPAPAPYPPASLGAQAEGSAPHSAKEGASFVRGRSVLASPRCLHTEGIEQARAIASAHLFVTRGRSALAVCASPGNPNQALFLPAGLPLAYCMSLALRRDGSIRGGSIGNAGALRAGDLRTLMKAEIDYITTKIAENSAAIEDYAEVITQGLA